MRPVCMTVESFFEPTDTRMDGWRWMHAVKAKQGGTNEPRLCRAPSLSIMRCCHPSITLRASFLSEYVRAWWGITTATSLHPHRQSTKPPGVYQPTYTPGLPSSTAQTPRCSTPRTEPQPFKPVPELQR
ncbi:unnamed protein product [Periconia digitata]|uniref:Uncharacterized protein n=1 Tax=Periconia digitata TaxID=1303443 RepID=A0A9W4UE92_9PLEO|nr:unnamed protein product [Periconia digitata]